MYISRNLNGYTIKNTITLKRELSTQIKKTRVLEKYPVSYYQNGGLKSKCMLGLRTKHNKS